MNIIFKITFAACAMLLSGSTLSAQCGYFNSEGTICPCKRQVIERCCCTRPVRACPKPYCPPPRVICYSCPSCPEYAAYWETQDAAMARDVINTPGAPTPSETEQMERTGFNDNGDRMGGHGMMMKSNEPNKNAVNNMMNDNKMMNK